MGWFSWLFPMTEDDRIAKARTPTARAEGESTPPQHARVLGPGAEASGAGGLGTEGPDRRPLRAVARP